MHSMTNWFTFAEVLQLYPSLAPVKANEVRTDAKKNWFYDILSAAGLSLRYSAISSNGSTIKEADVKKYVMEVMEILFDRHADEYIYKVIQYGFGLTPHTLTTDDFQMAINKFLNVMNLTLPKYIPLMYEYEKNYEHALKQLESESQGFNRFNDTPQDEQDEVDFNTPDYATNMGHSKSISKVDSGSVPSKLQEMQDKMRSIVLSWSNEFNGVFVDEYQLGGY